MSFKEQYQSVLKLCTTIQIVVSLFVIMNKKVDLTNKNADTKHNTTATLSARKGVAQPWRFFFACSSGVGEAYA